VPDLVVVGGQWGDEGKGKVVDFLAGTADAVVRFQGGPNAGHTVCSAGREFTFHQVPSGILYPKTRCFIGCGCVIDPFILNRELADLRRHKVQHAGRLMLDARAQMILPYHRLLDRLRDEQANRRRIGTTGQGIGPAYGDKVARNGIRAADLLNEDDFKDRLKRNVAAANFLLMERYKAEPLSFKKLAAEYWDATRSAARLVGDTSRAVEDCLRRGERVMFEGAQGMHLDLDLGTYPFVTSSSTWAGGVASGTGISPVWITEVLGIVKAYTTRVGMGPFPTELGEADAEHLRKLGHEYGATTGRPRRCGWFDAPVVRTSVRHNRLAGLVITKLDVLDSFEEIRVCHSYRSAGRTLDEFVPFVSGSIEPQYLTLPGWRESTSRCTSWRQLPARARSYIRKLEELCGCPVAIVSTGKDRSQTIVLAPRRLRWLKSS
jgi:adenylosuccinate synthase